ncbi:MAG: helix-turn-helix domain-containing protein [Bacillota bacterium]
MIFLLGKRLKELREERKMSQKQLGAMVNLSQQAIGHYEVDRVEPNIKTLELFARIFNTTSDYLLGLSDSRYPKELINAGSAAEDLTGLPETAQNEIEDFKEFVKGKYKK